MPSSLDFEMREGVPYSGWPFPLSYLEPWYRRAQPVLKLGPYGYALSWIGASHRADIPEPYSVACTSFAKFPAKARLQRDLVRNMSELRQAQNLSVYLQAQWRCSWTLAIMAEPRDSSMSASFPMVANRR